MIKNIAGYKFIPLTNLPALKASFLTQGGELMLKGTILLSPEGINLNLAGEEPNIAAFKTWLQADARFSAISFHETYSSTAPFRHFKVKLKPEIITLRDPAVSPQQTRAPSIAPEAFKQWLDEKKEIVVLDTRNEYEIQFGAFNDAMNLHINHFGEFPKAASTLDKDKTIVMYCTGGIRCEKAALYLLEQGYNDVYQLEGGILNYFAQVGGEHYEGGCFVFDERVAVGTDLQVMGVGQCTVCQGPISENGKCCER